jgi:hypothetical protein
MRILVSLIEVRIFGAADGVFFVGMLRAEVSGGWVMGFGGREVRGCGRGRGRGRGSGSGREDAGESASFGYYILLLALIFLELLIPFF